MLELIPLLPLVGFLVNASVGRRLSKPVSGGIAVGAMALSLAAAAAASWSLLQQPAGHRAIERTFYTWIASGDLAVPVALRLDPLAMVMVLVVTLVGTLIHLYSTAYMHEESEAEYARYFSYLNLFAACMLVLVLAPNFLVLFVGWEGVGLCSYLLIGFWYRRPSAADAGKKAFIVNRVGDAAFLLGVCLLFSQFETLDFGRLAAAVASRPPEAAFGVVSIATLLLFVGATGKSAQIPLHVWLPDAMEGPTPVSALIHAATMVTAGVYLIGRNSVLFSHAPVVLGIVAVVGVATALMAATIALVQHDIKRVLAYSTVSQLGLMFLAMGVGAFAAGIFHLYTHAFFKALLFLGAGAVIHALAGQQDLRRMGGLRRALPITYWTCLAGTMAIAGVPLLSGFFSKDEILYRTFSGGHPWLWGAAACASLLTACYMFRLLVLAFHGEPREAPEPDGSGHHGGAGSALHDAPPAMAVVLVVLAVGAVAAGYVGVPAALGGENRIEHFLAESFAPPAPVGGGATGSVGDAHAGTGPEDGHHSVGLERALMAGSVGLAAVGIALAMVFFLWRRDLAEAAGDRLEPIHRVLLHKYYVDEVYDAALVEPIKTIAEHGLWKGVDVSVIDGAVNGAGVTVRGASSVLRLLQTGSIRAAAASLIVGAVLVIALLVWW